jgi:hypothetical protein
MMSGDIAGRGVIEPTIIAKMNDPDLNRAGQAAETVGRRCLA